MVTTVAPSISIPFDALHGTGVAERLAGTSASAQTTYAASTMTLAEGESDDAMRPQRRCARLVAALASRELCVLPARRHRGEG
jgi:hypothetical protein